ncbi:hypothetical protein CEXT_134271 [Caerostris extrusa]|uniref:Uncharacterized protein n=1 Tax=Caerostris extrusa TaxID=172846 RepID=A0AAV4XH94_CAEEX|nr:hypothetical protein CEXT_134271 [Caerostris extrusa]
MHRSRTCPRGLMDKASDFESEDCRFESCRGRLLCNVNYGTGRVFFFLLLFRKLTTISYFTNCYKSNVRLFNITMHRSRTCPRGLMDKASDFESEDCRFESCRGRLLCNVNYGTGRVFFFLLLFRKLTTISYFTNCYKSNVRLFNITMHRSRTCPRGLMDKASDFESEDCRFESCRGRLLCNVNYGTGRVFFFFLAPISKINYHFIFYELLQIEREIIQYNNASFSDVSTWPNG